MYPVLFEIGPLTIYSLGVFWALGALAAVWILQLELKRYGYDPELAGTVVMTAAIGGLIGARLLFIVEEWEHFLRAPLSFLLSGSGFSWFGGLLVGGLITAWIFRKHRLPFSEAADMSAPALPLAYGIGRVGCFLAGDATWGKVSDVPWAMAFPNAVAGWVDPLTGIPYPPGIRVHPTQLYELIQSLIVFAILWSLRKRTHAPGMIFYLYLILAGSMRFLVEFWRVNPVVAAGLTEYQWMSVILVVIGIFLMCWQRTSLFPDPVLSRRRDAN
jgi:phosphatidylglycerol:prolipoprotein diacylglycerol transferase